MPSKLSIHLSAYPDHVFDIVGRMQPTIIKVFNYPSEINIDAIRARSPRTVVVYRQYTNLDYRSPADAFFAEMQDAFNKLRGRGILWEGMNEPVINSVDDASALNAWIVRFSQLVHAAGELVAGFSWSTGNPPQMDTFLPILTPAAAAVDVHAFHEYFSTWGGERDWGRYRLFEAMLPPGARKPVVITEAGLDDNGDPQTGGYRGKKSLAEYLDILERYDDILLQDPYVLGATVFQWGDGNWPSFDLTPMVDTMANYVASTGGGVVIPKPWPIPFQDAPAPTYTFSVTPGSIARGQSATLKWDVEGVKAVFLNGQGVTGHGTRAVSPTQTTTYTLHIIFQDNSSTDLTATLVVTGAPPPPSYSFSATPTQVVAGQSATLRWDVEGVRAVYLDGQGVTGHDTRTVAPAQTTTYTLHVVLLDGTARDLTATVTVTPGTSLVWDPRLDALGVQLKRTTAAHAWRVVSANYQAPDESGGKHHVFFKALQSDGSPKSGLKFVVDWVGRDPGDSPAYVVTDANGEANCPLWAALDPAKKNGIYFTLPATEPGDTVSGMGLTSGQNVNFILQYKFA